MNRWKTKGTPTNANRFVSVICAAFVLLYVVHLLVYKCLLFMLCVCFVFGETKRTK